MSLRESWVRCFETLCFEVPEADAPPPLELAWLEVQVRFRRAGSAELIGAVGVRAEPSLASYLVSAMLGIPRDADPATVRDGLGELANVLCGRALACIEPGASFDLESPRPGWSEEVHTLERFRFDGGRVEVGLSGSLHSDGSPAV